MITHDLKAVSCGCELYVCWSLLPPPTQVITTKEGMVGDVMNHFRWVSAAPLSSDCPLKLKGCILG